MSPRRLGDVHLRKQFPLMELGLENRSPLRDAHSANRLPQFVQAVFVDRDGTMGGTGRFIHPRDFDVYPFTREALANLRNEGFLLFALTNQYRISRGEATEEDFHREFEDLKLDGAYICPHDIDFPCNCKKPAPGMLLRAAEEHGLDLSRCVVIGDTGATDMLAAQAVGATKVLVKTGWGESSLGEYRHTWADVEPDYIAGDLLDAAKWVVEFSRQRGIWLGFIDTVKRGAFGIDDVKPLHQGLAPGLCHIVAAIAAKVPPDDWPLSPKMVVGARCDTTDHLDPGDYRDPGDPGDDCAPGRGHPVHFLVPLLVDGQETTFCFSFVLEGNRWFLRHIEAIVIPITHVPDLPATSFPDLPSATKDFMREEIAASERIRLWAFLKDRFGPGFATDWFKDGVGYALAARAWIPFLPPEQAFILYVCWEETRLRGGKAHLLELTSSSARISLKPQYLSVYGRATHLREQISAEDYEALWEAIWKDRAAHGGWQVEVKYETTGCTLFFTRPG